MKKVLIIAPYPPEVSPSQRYRFEHFLPFFDDEGLRYTYAPFLSEKTWYILYQKGRILQKATGLLRGLLARFVLMTKLGDYDFVFIHREAAPIGPPLFEWIIGRVFRKKIIFDFDDAIWLQEASENNRWISFLKWSRKTSITCRYAWRISVGNDYLKQYAVRYNLQTIVLPTVVNTTAVHKEQKQINRNTTLPVIGWTGTFSTLQYLVEILPVLQKLETEVPFRLLVIGNKDPQLPLKHYTYIDWSQEREAEDLLQIDIGIMPLPDNEWTRGKCGFKAIQYMSLGIPAVVAAVGVNSDIVTHGITGYVCETETDWYSALKTLLLNPDMRMHLGANARQTIEKKYSVQSQKSNFFSLFR